MQRPCSPSAFSCWPRFSLPGVLRGGEALCRRPRHVACPGLRIPVMPEEFEVKVLSIDLLAVKGLLQEIGELDRQVTIHDWFYENPST